MRAVEEHVQIKLDQILDLVDGPLDAADWDELIRKAPGWPSPLLW